MSVRVVAAAVAAFLLVPLVVTALFRLGSPEWLVVVLCAAVAIAVLLVPARPARWAAAGWSLGCVAWASALTVLLNSYGSGLDGL